MSNDRFKIIAPKPVFLPENGTLRRKPRRPVNFRDPNFERDFDGTTLFYDVFDSGHGELKAVGPPLWELRQTVENAEFQAAGRALLGKPDITEHDRCTVMRLVTEVPDARQLSINTGKGVCSGSIGADFNEVFRNARCVVTLSKDNDLAWINEWIRFHVRLHGADSFLFFDNGSTHYSTDDILEVARRIEGLERFWVISWPFKFGPQFGVLKFRLWRGLASLAWPIQRFQYSRGYTLWDSDFSQYAMLELVRWRFLQKASSVLNVDVDELVMPSPSAQTVFEATEQSSTGLVRFSGKWVTAAIDNYISGTPFTHRDFKYINPRLPLCAHKWCVVPHKCRPGSQWKVHEVPGMEPDHDVDFEFRHFTGINTGWKYDRTVFTTPPNPRYEIDDGLRELFPG